MKSNLYFHETFRRQCLHLLLSSDHLNARLSIARDNPLLRINLLPRKGGNGCRRSRSLDFKGK